VCVCVCVCSQAGLHLENNSRGGKIRFYESKGGNGVKICVCVSTQHLGGSGGMPQGNFCVLDSLRLLLVHSQVPDSSENDQKQSWVITVLMHSQVQFSAIVLAKMKHKQ